MDEHKFYAEPTKTAKRTLVVYVVGEDVVVGRVRADDAISAIRRAKNRIKKIARDL